MGSICVLKAKPAAPAPVLPHSPDLFIDFEQANATDLLLRDASGHNYHFTIPASANTPVLQQPPLSQDGLYSALFDGVDDRAFLTDTDSAWANSTTMTVDAIIDTVDTSSIITILERDYLENPRSWQFRLDNGKVTFLIIGGAVPVLTGTIPVNDGYRHHIAATFDGTTMRVYVDGVLDGSMASGTALPQTGGFSLGAHQFNTITYYPFDGNLDSLGYFRRALTATEIAERAARMIADTPPPPPPASFTDDFNRANGAPGNGWTTYGPALDWQISGNQLGVVSGAVLGDGTLLREAGTDVKVSATINGSTSTSTGLVVRAVDNNNLVLLDTSGGAANLYVKNNGSYGFVTNFNIALGDILEIETVGTTLTVRKNGVQQYTNTAFGFSGATGTKAGFRKDTGGGLGGMWDDFSWTAV